MYNMSVYIPKTTAGCCWCLTQTLKHTIYGLMYSRRDSHKNVSITSCKYLWGRHREEEHQDQLFPVSLVRPTNQRSEQQVLWQVWRKEKRKAKSIVIRLITERQMINGLVLIWIFPGSMGTWNNTWDRDFPVIPFCSVGIARCFFRWCLFCQYSKAVRFVGFCVPDFCAAHSLE